MTAVDEHLATRSSAGLFDFSFMGLYEFAGITALEGLQTRRLQDIAPGQAAYTLLLSDDGTVFNDATVWNLGGDRWWLFTGRPSDFERFRDRARDRSGEHAILALQGPRSGVILSRLVGEATVRALRYFHFGVANGMLVARLGYSGELGYELLVPAGEKRTLRDSLLDAGKAEELAECSFDAANSLRIESGYVLFDREIDGKANPRELGLERLVSRPRHFDVSRRLVGLQVEGEELREERVRVQVTSECWSPTLNARIALGFAPAHAAPGDRVRLADQRAARVAVLPFYDRGRERPRAAPL